MNQLKKEPKVLWGILKETMLKTPKQVVCEQKAEMTYEELVMFAEVFAKKIEGERCCAILCGSEMAAGMSLLSCFAAGVTAVPLSVRYGELHCNKILDTISPSAVITDMDGKLQVISLKNAKYVEPLEHPALIMCTSGTTGEPKGVMLSEKNVLTNIRDITSYFDIKHEDIMLISRPLYHCAVLTGEFITGLLKGAKIRFYSGEFNPRILLDMIEKHQITVLGGTPTMFQMLARFKQKDKKDSLKKISISGECMSKEVGMKIRNAFSEADIYYVYGLTEASPRVSYLPPSLFDKYPDAAGIPLHSVSLKIINAEGKSVGIEEEGILWVKGENVMLGYYNAPKQTKEVLKDGWLCTGDIAYIDANGLLRIKGRADDMIIRAGMNIYSIEVEETLKLDPRVEDVVVYKMENPHMGDQIGMKISGDFRDVDEVKQMCIELLPSFQVPTWIELLQELPRNGSGKLERRAS